MVRTVSCFRYFAYSDCFDWSDEYLQLSEPSLYQSIKAICALVVDCFGEYYLNRTPSVEERDRILIFNAKRGFPGMFASWDCSHFKWDKCPVQYHGAYKSRCNNSKTVVMECVVDCHMWVWYMNFENAGSLNDINILDKSSIVTSIWNGSFNLKCPRYEIQNLVCDYMYLLVDGIYPPWSIIINTIRSLVSDNERRFSKQQEGCRKDLERVFAIIQNIFQILKNALHLHTMEDINDVVHCCIILHNMMVEKG